MLQPVRAMSLARARSGHDDAPDGTRKRNLIQHGVKARLSGIGIAQFGGMANVEIDDDVVTGRNGRDKSKECLRRCLEALIFGVHRDDMDAPALVVIFGGKARMPLRGQGPRVDQRTVAVVAPSEHFEHTAA